MKKALIAFTSVSSFLLPHVVSANEIVVTGYKPKDAAFYGQSYVPESTGCSFNNK